MTAEAQIQKHRFIYRHKHAPLFTRKFNLWGPEPARSGQFKSWDAGKCRMCYGVIYEFSWAEMTEYPRLCGKCRYALRTLLWSHNCDADTDEIPF